MALFYLAVLVFLAGFVHARQVERRKRRATAAGAATFAAAVADGGGKPGGGVGAVAAAGLASIWESVGPPKEYVHVTSSPPAGAHGAAANGGYGGYGGGVEGVQLDGLPRSGSDQSARTPFEHPAYMPPASSARSSWGRDAAPATPVAGKGGGKQAGGGGGGSGAVADPVVADGASGSSGLRLHDKESWLQSLFSVHTLRDAKPRHHGPPAAGPAPGSVGGGAPAAPALPSAGPLRGAERLWLSAVFKQLITHLQLLGLLRGLRVNWPDGVHGALVFFDQVCVWGGRLGGMAR